VIESATGDKKLLVDGLNGLAREKASDRLALRGCIPSCTSLGGPKQGILDATEFIPGAVPGVGGKYGVDPAVPENLTDRSIGVGASLGMPLGLHDCRDCLEGDRQFPVQAADPPIMAV
jgi:hypothetical protein